MPDFGSNEFFEFDELNFDPDDQSFLAEQDLLMEQILENINTTPIGRVLKRIASMPEVRKEKVLGIRRELNKGKYDLNQRLDVALEKVLHDITK